MSKKTFSSRIKTLGFKIERLTANQNYVWVEIGSKKNIAHLVEAEDYFLDETETPF